MVSEGANENNYDNSEPIRAPRRHKIRYQQNVPPQFTNNLMPTNAFEQKNRFLTRKLTPEFQLNMSILNLELSLEANRILDVVCKRFGSIDKFVDESFGARISIDEASKKISEYIKDCDLPTSLDVIWCEDLIGTDRNGNIPRHRKFTMLLKTNEENTYLRENGILSLMDHEIGTHYHRSFNEGHQPWYGKREIYGLGSTQSCEAISIEEGLATLHTILRAKHQYLGVSALLYYGACMAEYLPFKELFEHLGKYVINEEQRWKHCMRVKRCLLSQDKCGGYGKDQRYFEGAISILRQQANIDFTILMSGKLTLRELEKASHCVTTSAIRLPYFMHDLDKYLKSLRRIARVNGVAIAKPDSLAKGRRRAGLPATAQTSTSSMAASSTEQMLNLAQTEVVSQPVTTNRLFRKSSCPLLARSTNSNDQSSNELNLVKKEKVEVTPRPKGVTQLTRSSSRTRKSRLQSPSIDRSNCTLENTKLSTTASTTNVKQTSKEAERQQSKTNAPNVAIVPHKKTPDQLCESASIGPPASPMVETDCLKISTEVSGFCVNCETSLTELTTEKVAFTPQSPEPLVQPESATQQRLTANSKRLLEQCAALQLPACNITNSFRSIPDAGKGESLKGPAHERMLSRDAVISGRQSLVSRMKELPTGVCGCRIFTHGSLRPKATIKPTEDGEGTDEKVESSMEHSVPLFLEIDLKHPLVGV